METKMKPYIPLPDDHILPEDIKKILATVPPLNVFRMFANAPASFKGINELARSILLESQFDPRKREIAVLRVAHATRSEYEWTQHVLVAKMTGVTDGEIEIIRTEDPVTSLDEESNLLCRVADEISNDVRLSDEALSRILSRYGIQGATELILCVSYFNMISRFLESTRVSLEKEQILKPEQSDIMKR
jgi:4-carboxymuconolactone decarboxylase